METRVIKSLHEYLINFRDSKSHIEIYNDFTQSQGIKLNGTDAGFLLDLIKSTMNLKEEELINLYLSEY